MRQFVRVLYWLPAIKSPLNVGNITEEAVVKLDEEIYVRFSDILAVRVIRDSNFIHSTLCTCDTPLNCIMGDYYEVMVRNQFDNEARKTLRFIVHDEYMKTLVQCSVPCLAE